MKLLQNCKGWESSSKMQETETTRGDLYVHDDNPHSLEMAKEKEVVHKQQD